MNYQCVILAKLVEPQPEQTRDLVVARLPATSFSPAQRENLAPPSPAAREIEVAGFCDFKPRNLAT